MTPGAQGTRMTDALFDPLLDATSKGFPPAAAPLRRSAIGAQGWNVLAGDLPLPLAVIRRGRLQHNLGWMQDYAGRTGVELAPHGKTTMSPQLLQAQLQRGAWGLTFASVTQARVGVAAGARRILIANQVMQAADLHGIAALQAEHPDLRIVFLLDSAAQLAMLEAVAPARPFEVLLELGLREGRTGCRTHEEAAALARLARGSAAVQLAGIECYEGLAATGDDAADRTHAQALMERVHAIARLCDAEGLFEGPEVILSAGGSAIFDLVVPGLKASLSRPVNGLLRSGCYVTHDHGFYRRMVEAVNRRLGCSESEGLQPAIEVWAAVQSLPEPGLAILSVGKRDISYDLGLPLPLSFSPLGTRAVHAAPEAWTVSGLNDQHAYLRLGAEPAGLRVGDRVALGISHPCTTFDKWRWMPVVDEARTVVDAIVTCF
jgi:D-serine dehydratase